MSPSNKSGRNISHITSNHEYFENICSSLWLESPFSILYLLSSDLYIFISWIDWKCFVRWCLCGQKLKKRSSYFTARLMLNQKSILSHWSCLAAIREAIRNLEVLQQTILCNLTTACIWRTLTAFTLSSHKQCYKVLRRATKRGKMFNYWRFLISPSSGKNKRRKISVIASVTFLPGSLTKSCKIASGSHERQSFPQTFTAPA